MESMDLATLHMYKRSPHHNWRTIGPLVITLVIILVPEDSKYGCLFSNKTFFALIVATTDAKIITWANIHTGVAHHVSRAIVMPGACSHVSLVE